MRLLINSYVAWQIISQNQNESIRPERLNTDTTFTFNWLPNKWSKLIFWQKQYFCQTNIVPNNKLILIDISHIVQNDCFYYEKYTETTVCYSKWKWYARLNHCCTVIFLCLKSNLLLSKIFKWILSKMDWKRGNNCVPSTECRFDSIELFCVRTHERFGIENFNKL